MSNVPYSFTKPETPPAESYVEVRVPESTYHLFNAIFEHEILSEEELAPINAAMAESMSVNAALYPAPAEYADTGAPKGSFTPGMLPPSAFYPDSPHPYWVYVPAAYDPEKPAHLAVFLDAPMYTTNMQTRQQIPYPDALFVLDNLISKGAIPPTIALFISFGLSGPGQPLTGLNEGPLNRSFEYDTVSDWHTRFLTEEVFPQTLSAYSISEDPADHVIIGMSSSGIAAFTAAWFRPDFFGNVIIASPSFANIRGGIVWPSAIRVNDPKPIRIFSVVGKHDINNPFGSWLAGNMDVASALKYKKYDYRYYLSEAGHSIQVHRYILPQALQWVFAGREPEFDNLEKFE